MATSPYQKEISMKVKEENNTEIADFVLDQLGTPPNFSHVNVINIFDNRFRVNVYTKEEGFIDKMTISASFYIINDKDDIHVSPEITPKFLKN